MLNWWSDKILGLKLVLMLHDRAAESKKSKTESAEANIGDLSVLTMEWNTNWSQQTFKPVITYGQNEQSNKFLNTLLQLSTRAKKHKLEKKNPNSNANGRSETPKTLRRFAGALSMKIRQKKKEQQLLKLQRSSKSEKGKQDKTFNFPLGTNRSDSRGNVGVLWRINSASDVLNYQNGLKNMRSNKQL
ncbi:hypothetical protein RFI_01907 [Reticulomyxa filosa]|uniref:Uncharacterized protein n=1 Tax=Reticulomyxa filosa TaxID=46433 RepID=X6PBX6_RETFI|nr:hypothetical protein RFI_01907 [Reticulomyxa filosa]|eukprot:ETO35172.1 hypothetical protein RFI_01907 [Reticulomyxa filosa]